MQLSEKDELEFNTLAEPILSNEKVQLMKTYVQHGRITTFDHVLSVSKTAFMLNKKWGWTDNEDDLVKACLLHDFYLYDWHDAPINVPLHQMHGYTHPGAACKMAVEVFDVDEEIQKAIKSHMWPLNFFTFPSGRIAWLLCISDKYCALTETLFKR